METLRNLLTSAAKFLGEAESCIAQVKSLCKQPQKLEKDMQLLAAAVKKYDELKSVSNHYKALVLDALGKMSVTAVQTSYTLHGRDLRLYLNDSGSLVISYDDSVGSSQTVCEFVESSSCTDDLCNLIVDALSRSLVEMASVRARNAECVEKLSLLVTQLLKEKKFGMKSKRPSQ